jgi:hypothetical protein
MVPWPLLDDSVKNDSNRNLEAARYAILMRIGPALRHGLMGQMQGMQFLGELAVRQSKPGKDPKQVLETIAKMPAQSQAAIARCHSLALWLRSNATDVMDLATVMEECRQLLDVEFSLRGIRLLSDTPAGVLKVTRAPVAELLVGSLLAMADETVSAATLQVSAAATGADIEMSVTRTHDGATDLLLAPAYRALRWDDVQVLADAANARLSVAPDKVQMVVQTVEAGVAS